MENSSLRPNQTFQLIQSKASHEENLMHVKGRVDNKLSNYAHIYDLAEPSKKNYIWREKNREIENGNVRLLNKIYTIMFDRRKEFPSKYDRQAKLTKDCQEENPLFHPFSKDSRIRSLNIVNRKRETDRINRDNYMIMSKLKNSKPTVCCFDEAKKRGKQIKKLEKLVSKKDRAKTPTPLRIFPNPSEAFRRDGKVGSYLRKHEHVPQNVLYGVENDVQKDMELVGLSSGGGSRSQQVQGYGGSRASKYRQRTSSQRENRDYSVGALDTSGSRKPPTASKNNRAIKNMAIQRGKLASLKYNNNQSMTEAIETQIQNDSLLEGSHSVEKLEGNKTFDIRNGEEISHSKIKGYIPTEDLDSEFKKIEQSYM